MQIEESKNEKVTIIVRSLGRASLDAALVSVERQTYRPLAVLVVNATAAAHPPLPREYSVPVRIVDVGRALTRPQAANVGLDNSDGEYLALLDDDDTYEPDHVATLLDTLHREPENLIAYSGTRIIGEDGKARGALSLPFNRLALLKGNYIQAGAVLFSAQLLALGCRFDEDMLMLQDWDFWIQVCRYSAFSFTGKLTNNWNAFSGGSGAGLGANHNAGAVAAYSAAVAAKWAGLKSQLLQKYRYAAERANGYARNGRRDQAQHWAHVASDVLSGPPPKA